jgi:hypothetical protein
VILLVEEAGPGNEVQANPGVHKTGSEENDVTAFVYRNPFNPIQLMVGLK